MKKLFTVIILTTFTSLFLISCEKASLKSGEVDTEYPNDTGLNDLFVYNIVSKTNKQITHTPDSIESRYLFFHKSPNFIFFTGKAGFYMNVDETGKRKWIDTLLYTSPDLSANDQTIVYSLNKNLYLMNSDGTNNRQLTHDDLNLQLPQWAPDGQKIACNKAGTLYLVTLDGNVTTLSSGSIDRYNWSSDSKSIVYSKSIAGKRQIFKYDLIAQSETQLTSLQKNCLFPIFNPVNSKICFVTSSPGIELIIMESDGSNQKSLIQKAAITEPCYSPDGLHITFQVGNDNTSSTQNIAICDIDGSNYQIINKDQGNCSIPVWSNDGNYILYRRLAPLGI